MRRTAALIVGGGPAGSAAAITLARQGGRPLLIERSRVPEDALCGGFMGWDALAALDRLGLDVRALGGHPVERVRLFAGDRQVEARLPAPAAGLSRRTLDAALLAQAEACGAGIERGVMARTAAPGRVELSGEVIETDVLFLATGKHELRGTARPSFAAGDDPVIGMRARFAPSPATQSQLSGVIELHLLDRGYAGLVLQEDGAVNLCMSLAGSRLTEAGGRPEALWDAIRRESPRLAERAGDIAQWQTISRVPYGWRARATVPGLYRLGDQAAVIPSLAGDGIAIALASGRMAAEACLRDGPAGAPRFQRRFAARARRPVALAQLLRAVGERPSLAHRLLPWLAHIPAALPLLASFTRIDR